MQQSLHSTAARMEITPPKLLRTGAVLILCAYGLFLAIPFVISMLVVSVLKLSLMTVLLPLATVAATVYVLPFGFGNPYVVRLVGRLQPPPPAGGNKFIVQLTVTPRIRSGFQAVLEDADDLGWLSFTESELVFCGDSVRVSIPFHEIQQVRPRSIGWRGLFVYGPRVSFVVPALPDLTRLEFAERSSLTLPGSRKTARELYTRLLAAVPRQAR